MNIDAELTAVESALSSNIPALESAYKNLSSQLGKFSQVLDGELSNVSTHYTSAASSSLQSEISNLSTENAKTKEAFEVELKGLIDRTKALVGNIGILKQKLVDARNATNYFYYVSSLTPEQRIEKNVNYIYALNNKNTKVREFNEYQDKLKGELSSLKGLNLPSSNVKTLTLESLGDIEVIAGEVNTIEFEYNGYKYEYMLYVPETTTDVELPLITYLPGRGERGDNLTTKSLPKAVAEGEDYPAIILMPVIPTNVYAQSNAMVEVVDAMTDEVIANYNVDEDCIGATGHSDGAVAVYSLVAKNPDKYSVAAPVSGVVTDDSWYDSYAESNTSFHIVHGNSDPTVGYWCSTTARDKLESLGVDVELESIQSGHDIGNEVFIEGDLISDMINKMYEKKAEANTNVTVEPTMIKEDNEDE